MTDFVVHTLDTAPDASQSLLKHSQQLYGGMIPNLHGVMAEAPPLLEAYQALNAIFDRTALTIVERNIVWLTVNFLNDCHYCMAAHTAIAMHSGLHDDDIAALRQGQPLEDAKHEALRTFTRQVVEKQGWVSAADCALLINAGYTQATILEVILAIGMKTLSNYTNHIANTPVDSAFEKFSWEKPQDK